jgi:hypothetical protein
MSGWPKLIEQSQHGPEIATRPDTEAKFVPPNRAARDCLRLRQPLHCVRLGGLDPEMSPGWPPSRSSATTDLQSQTRTRRVGDEGRADRSPRKAGQTSVRALLPHAQLRILCRYVFDMRRAGLRALVEGKRSGRIRRQPHRDRTVEALSDEEIRSRGEIQSRRGRRHSEERQRQASPRSIGCPREHRLACLFVRQRVKPAACAMRCLLPATCRRKRI